MLLPKPQKSPRRKSTEAENRRHRIDGIAVVQQPNFICFEGTRDLETFSSRSPL